MRKSKSFAMIRISAFFLFLMKMLQQEESFLYTEKVGFVGRTMFFLWEKCASMSKSTGKN